MNAVFDNVRPIKMGRQLGLDLRQWGGRRRGAGRKPAGERAGVAHRRRPALARRFPVHVTVRMRAEVYGLRSRRCFSILRAAFGAQNGRFGFRLNQYSVQGNHIHFIVEAEDRQSLTRGMKGLSVRIAKGLNRLMRRRGRVLADRYHAHVLRTPGEVRRALDYVLDNARRHFAAHARIDRYSSAAPDAAVAAPRTWLLQRALALASP
jgi:REP element-mobilizing transposase RayT